MTIEEVKKFMETIEGTQQAANQFPPAITHPCPSCGHCPTCGRGGFHTAPYNPYPNWYRTHEV